MPEQDKTASTKSTYLIEDPSAFAKNMALVAAQSQHLFAEYLTKQGERKPILMQDSSHIATAFADLSTRMLANPTLILQAQMELWQSYADIWAHATKRFSGENVPDLANPPKGDKRFKDKDWTENAVFDVIKNTYLTLSQWVRHTVASVDGMDDHTRQKVDFYTKQFIDAVSPSNFVLTNPEVLRTTLASNGENLVKGLANMIEDLDRGHGELAIRMTDMNAFKIGENVATAPGKVIYRNEIIELLQFDPTTETVYKRPLVIFPPWINKYYILDLRPENSFIRWASAQGYTVFVASWCNPDQRLAEATFEDYMHKGILDALTAVEKATGEREVSAIGYCIGGTLLAATLAYMAAKGDDRIKFATFFAAQADFSEAGELQVFIDEDQIRGIEEIINAEGGVMPASRMSSTFNMLRSNDLIWSFVVNNYLLGKDPFPFDLLYWNADQTNLPKSVHLFYLRECYLKNTLALGQMNVGGVTLDLSKVKTPVYLLSSKEDHIAPFRSVFKSTKLFGGPKRFIVAGSGHIAGVINPPVARKYQFWANESDPTPLSLDKWWAGAKETPGSWWLDWDQWASAQSGPRVKARVPGDGKLKPLEDAPGSYVRVRAM
jgi:polyhydroxyalkanoate synthase